MRSQLKKVTSVILCVCMLMSMLAIISFAEETTATISFADKADRTSYSTEQQVWAQNGITVTNDKGESTSNVGDYANPGRFYKSSTFKIEYPGMTKITIDCTGLDAKYVDAWVDSFEGATANEGIVTVEFTEAVDSASVKMAAQGRANSITVYTAAGSEGGEKTAANLTSDIGIMYVGAPGVYEGVTTLVTEVGTHNFSWDKAVLLEKVADNVYEVIATAPGDGNSHNLVIENADQFIVAANGGNNWPALFETAAGTEWFYNGSNSHGVAYKECPNFCSEHIGAWFANVGKMEIGSYYKFVGIDPTAPAVDANYAVDYEKDPAYGYTKSDYVTYSFLTATEAPVVEDDTLTIEEAIALGESKEHNTYTTEKYYVTGVITSVYNTQYGNMYIEDENGNSLTIYGTYSADGSLRYDALEVKPVKGDTVTIYGVVGQYSGSAQIKNGWIVNHVPGEGEEEEVVPDPEADSTLTIEQAIALGTSKDHNNYTTNKYYVTGVITEVYNEQYGNMYIKDENGNTLTIYGTYSEDGELRYDALEVKPVAGDTVTIYGIVGQYSGTAQIKNGWITAHTPATDDEVSDDEVSDEVSDDDTPVLGDSGFAVEMVIIMVIALAAVAVIYTNKRRA